ncbi:MAG: DMT family transporter [Anaerolineales bacterium]|nr:DMT family transporter [Anaerolineales bacterium]
MKTRDWLAFIALGMIWGSSFLWIKIAVQEVNPILLVAYRIFFGIIGLAVIVLHMRPQWPVDFKTWTMLTILGIFNNALPYALISWGEQYIDSAVAAILNSTTPLFTMIIANIFLRDDRLTLARALGLLIGFAGIVVLVSRDLIGGIHLNLLGQGAVLLASFSYACSVVFARRITHGVPPLLQALIPLLGADLIMWISAIGVAYNQVEAEASSRFITILNEIIPNLPLTWIALLWLGFLGTGIAYLIFFNLLHSVGPTRTTLVTYVFPLVAVILGIVFLGETLNWQLFVGGSLVVGSIITANRQS